MWSFHPNLLDKPFITFVWVDPHSAASIEMTVGLCLVSLLRRALITPVPLDAASAFLALISSLGRGACC